MRRVARVSLSLTFLVAASSSAWAQPAPASSQLPETPPTAAPPAPPPPPPTAWTPPAAAPPAAPPGYGQWQGYPNYYAPYGYNPAVFQLPPPPRKEPYSQSMTVSGILMTVGGALSVVTGAALLAMSQERIDVYRDGPEYWYSMDDPTMKGGGIAMMVIGGVVGAAGVTFWIIGSKSVRVKSTTAEPAVQQDARRAPMVRVGPGSASLSMPF